MTITITYTDWTSRVFKNIKNIHYDGRYLTLVYQVKKELLSIPILASDILEWDAL